MRRVAVVGNSGSGKTTLARTLAGRLDVPFVELDSIYHQAGWQPLPKPEFRRRVAEITATDAWVLDGNYTAVRDLIWQRADTVVWLDLPRHVVMRQVTSRTLSRAVRRAELWNGNREQWRNMLSFSPEKSIIWWAWTRHAIYRQRYGALSADPAYAHLTFVRVESPDDADRLLREARFG